MTLGTHAAVLAGLGGLAAFIATFVVISTVVRGRVCWFWRSLEVVFPSDERPRS